MDNDRSVREYPSRPIVGVGAVILITPDDRTRIAYEGEMPATGIVLVRRRFEPLAGRWSLPGGAVELGETLDAAVRREVAEETGLSVDVGVVIDAFSRIMLDQIRRVQYHFVLVDYLCRPSGGRLQHGSDVSDVHLADVADLKPFTLTDTALAMIQRATELAAI